MGFKAWLESMWYHGTQAGDDIRRSGQLNVSTSGGGQRGLMGVWLTKDPSYAEIYANALREAPGQPEVIQVEIPDSLNIADLYAIQNSLGSNDAQRAMWKFVGFDVDDMAGMQPVRDLQPYAMTKLLQQQGYDGALIPNTIQKGGEPELVIFDPKNVKLIV